MILLHFHWHSFLGCFLMFSLHLADKVGISSPMCSWPEIEKSNLALGQWTITKVLTEKVSSKILLEGWLSVPVKEKKSKNHRKERKEKGPADDFKRSLLVRFTLVTEKIDEKNTEKKRKDTVSEECCLLTLVTEKNWRKKHRKEKKRYSFRGSLLVHPGHTPSLNDLKRLRQLVLDLLNNQK